MKFKLGDTDIPFVFRGDELMYPNYVKDGLILHYDFSGMTNADTSRGIATDLSGNGNHGTLQNFNYTAESGYDKNKLLFDGVDDYVQVPETGLNPESMAVVDNGKIYSYEGGIVTSIDTAGNIEKSNVNLMSNINLKSYAGNGIKTSDGWYVADSGSYGGVEFYEAFLLEGESYTISWEYKTTDADGWLTIIDNSLVGVERFVYDSNKRYSTIKDGKVHKKIMQITATRTHIVGIGLLRTLQEGTIYYRNLKVEKGTVATPYNPSPIFVSDRESIDSIYSPMNDLLLYNRPLTDEEIAHNYAIERERFGIQ